jgi:predicted metal-dependent peptidase
MTTEKQFDSILLKFLLDEPFFATIIRGMQKNRTTEIETAGVSYQDGTMKLFWNPKFVSSLERKKVFGLLKHECYHLIFKHVTTRKQKPHMNWNIATDLAINSIIPISELPECGLVPGKKNKLEVNEGVEISKERKEMIDKFGDFIASLPKLKSSEWYMNEIQNNKEISKIVKELYEEKVLVVMDEHDNSNLSEADKIIADQKVKDMLSKAKDIANKRGWGSTSFSVRSEIEKITTDKFNWERALKYFCGSKMRSNFFKTQRKINRKYPYIHPGRKAKKTSHLAIYVDQSGSVGVDSLARFGKVLQQLSKTHTFTYYFFDSHVDEESKTSWQKGKSSNFTRRLSGGTSFEAVEDHFRKVSRLYDGYVVMTDGYADKPKTCISKRCWVICPGGSLQFKPEKRDYVIKMGKEYR